MSTAPGPTQRRWHPVARRQPGRWWRSFLRGQRLVNHLCAVNMAVNFLYSRYVRQQCDTHIWSNFETEMLVSIDGELLL